LRGKTDPALAGARIKEIVGARDQSLLTAKIRVCPLDIRFLAQSEWELKSVPENSYSM
jgi:hypothetical protein